MASPFHLLAAIPPALDLRYKRGTLAAFCWNCVNGIYSQRFVRLDRYKLGDRVYHVPQDLPPDENDTTFKSQINGLIQHSDRFTVDGWKACQLLLIRYAPFVLLNYWAARFKQWLRWRFFALKQHYKPSKIDELPF